MAGGGAQTDPMLTWAVIAGLLLAAIFGMWIIMYAYLGPALIWIKMMELWPLTFISADAQVSYNKLQGWYNSLQAYDSAKFDSLGYGRMWGFVVMAGVESGQHYRHIVGGLFIAIWFYVLFFCPETRFTQKHTLDSFIGMQSKAWPVIAPFIKFSPIKLGGRAPGAKVPTELPLFAEAFYPEEWMAFHRIRVINGVPDRDQIRRALIPQLGPRFESIEALPDHLYCLLATFCLRAARKRDESDALLGKLAMSWSDTGGFRSSAQVRAEAEKVFKERKYVEPMMAVIERHAYVTTVMLAVLAWARRQGGVLAPAQFVWLRAEHREAWYPLNNLGRRSFHVEAAGAMAHYIAEMEAARPLIMPQVDAAVVAIVQYLSETRARIPELVDSRPAKAVSDGNKGTLKLAKPARS